MSWLFCRGDKDFIDSLISFFSKYDASSSQMVNPQKYFIFGGSVNEARFYHIASQLGFKIGHLPFSYLGVPIRVSLKLGILDLFLTKLKLSFPSGRGIFLVLQTKFSWLNLLLPKCLPSTPGPNLWLKNWRKALKFSFGRSTTFWPDPWCGPPLVNRIQDVNGINTNTWFQNSYTMALGFFLIMRSIKFLTVQTSK